MAPPRFRLAVAGRTDVGRQRKHNEDHVLIRPDLGLFVVADGMGGHNAGNVASALTTTSVGNFFEATRTPTASITTDGEGPVTDEDGLRLAESVRKANRDVYEISTTFQQHHGMGSTIVAAYVPHGNERIAVAHVGDSRCYRVRNGILRQLTSDHSLVCDALLMKPDLSHDELARLPKNIITRALGMRDAVAVDVATDELREGDLYLLCSDGLSGMVDDEQILDILSVTEDVDEACEVLVTMANEAGGTDNITALIVRVELAPVSETTVTASPVMGFEDTFDPGSPLEAALAARAESEPDVTDGADTGDRTSMEPFELLDAVMKADKEVARTLALVSEPIEDPPTEEPEPRQATPIPPETPVIVAPVPIPMAFCNRCGFEVYEGNVFCVECGVRLDDETIYRDAT